MKSVKDSSPNVRLVYAVEESVWVSNIEIECDLLFSWLAGWLKLAAKVRNDGCMAQPLDDCMRLRPGIHLINMSVDQRNTDQTLRTTSCQKSEWSTSALPR